MPTRQYSLPSRAVATCTAVLDAARSSGYTVTRLKLAKLLYLVDLEAVSRGDDPVSGIEWRWLHHGPFNNALLAVEDELVGEGSICRTTEPFYGGNVLQLVRDMHEDELTSGELSLVQRVVSKFGHMAAVSLKDLSYQTPPMIDAQARGRGVVLNLELARPTPKLRKAADRLRAVLKDLPAQTTDPGVDKDIKADIDALSGPRARATRRLLDCD